MATQAELAEQLEQLSDELAEALARNLQLEAELRDGGLGGELELREEVLELRAQLARAEDERERSMDAGKSQEARARELDLQTKALKMDKLRLEAELQKTQERLETAEENLHAMRQRSEQAVEHEGRLGEHKKSLNKTLVKTLTENTDLRNELARHEADIKTLYQAVTEKEEELKAQNANLEASRQELQDTESEVEELKRLLAERDAALAAAQEEVSAAAEMEVEVEERVKAKVDKWKAKVRSVQADLEAERAAQKDLQKRCDALLVESGLREIEQELVASEEKAASVAKELAKTREELEAAKDDMRELARDNDALRADQGKFIDIALEKEKAEIERLKQVLVHRDQILEEERARYRELDEEKAAVEEELQDREFTLAEYERGHGLTEAVVKQKKLKGDIKRRDKEIRRLNQALSERIAAHEKLYETCRRLKKKAGVPESFQYDDLELEEGMRGQTERLQALIRELESQNEALEDERVRLLDSLRVNALNMGEKGMKLFGLTAEQITQVNQFVDNLREGRVELPLNDKSLQLREEIRDLKQRLRETERDLAAAELRVENNFPVTFPEASDPIHENAVSQYRDPSDPNSSSVGSSTFGHDKRHGISGGFSNQEQLEKLARDQQAMMAEMKLDIQRTISNFMSSQQLSIESLGRRRDGQGSPSHMPMRSPHIDPGYEKLMQMLQSKLEAGSSGQTKLDRDQVESMRNELERQSAMNEQLTHRLQEAELLLERIQQAGPDMLISPSPRATRGGGHGGYSQARSSSPFYERSELEMPSTMVGQQFAEQHITQYRLPPEEWTEPMILANNRLTACMERLLQKERETVQLESSLQDYAKKIETHASQMAILYREYVEARENWKMQTDNLRKEADEARGERDALRVKARRLDTLCAVLDGDDHDARTHAKDLTRKVAILEVNEVVLARRYNLIVEEERLVRQEKEILQHEMIQAETALRERVLYLEEWKAGAQAQLDAMQRSMDRLVPRDSHEQVVRKLAQVNHKYRDLLAREAQLRGKTSGAQALRRRVNALESDLELARTEATRFRKENLASKEQYEWLQRRLGEEEAPSEQNDLIQQVAKFKGDAVEKEIVLASTVKKADILDKRATDLAKELESETERADRAEESLEAAREVIKKIEQELSELQSRFQGGATSEERKVLDERIKDLENMYKAISREAERHRELADIATTQVQAFEALQNARVQETDTLREQLREVNARSDDDAIIGKLQHELTTTKVSYQLFVRKFEKAQATVRRYEIRLRKQEAQIDEKDRVLQQTREEVRSRILALESALEHLGASPPPNPSNATNTASLALVTMTSPSTSMANMEQLSEMIARLGESAEHSEEALRRSETSRRHLESEIEAKRIELETMASAMEDLKHRVLSTPDENSKDGSIKSEHRNLAQRLLQLNEDLKAAKLDSMRQSREMQLLKEEKTHLEKLRSRDEEHMLRLEEGIANMENTLRRYEDERRLQRFSDSHPRSALGFPMPKGSSVIDSSDHLVRELGEEEVRSSMLQIEKNIPSHDVSHTSSATLAELDRQLREAEDREERFQRQLQHKANQVRLLRKRLRAEGLPDDPEDLNLDEDDEANQGEELEYASATGRQHVKNRAANLYQADARKLQVAAQQSVASFKDIIARKNQTIEALKQKLEMERKAVLAERERDQAEIERLTEKLYEDNRDAINNLRTAYEDISRGAIPGQGDEGGAEYADAAYNRELVDRLEEADIILERKDRRILELERMVEELQILRGKAEDRAGQSAEIAETLREKVRRMAEQNEAHGAKELLKQLRGQLAAKEKTLAGLRSAVLALKTEFVKAEEEHEQELIKRDRAMNALSSTVRKPSKDDENQAVTANVRDQLEALRERVEQTQQDLDNTKRREEKFRTENSKLRQELQEQADEAELRGEEQSRSGADVGKLQRKIDELRRENRRLRENLQNLQALQTRGGGESKAPDNTQRNDHSDTAASSQEIERLEKRVKVLEAQNAALRSAAKSSGYNSNHVLSATSHNANANQDSKSRWEADKKLEKKVALLTRRLEERTRELEASRAQTQQAKQLVEKVSQQARSLRAPSSAWGATANGASRTVKEQEQVRDLRRNLDEALQEIEEKNDQITELRRLTEIEHPSEIAKLNSDLRATRVRLREAEDELESLQFRKRHRTGNADSLQIAEDQYSREDELRQQLNQSRRDARELENELLDRDNTILELRFEMEQLSSRYEKVRRDDEMKQGSSSPAHSAPRAPGERFKRERDLENVVESMKKVVSKLQAENERLKRSSTSNARYTDLQKQVKSLKQENQELIAQKESLQQNSSKYNDASAKAIRLQDAVRNLRRQVRSLEADVDKERAQATSLRTENEKLADELQQASDRLTGRQPHSGNGRDYEVDDLRRKVREQTRVIEALRMEVTAATDLPSVISLGAAGHEVHAELDDLREENRRLKNELNAFDMDFFEEIEDLKYRYQQATEENSRLRARLLEN